MEVYELIKLIEGGENTYVQFKEDVTNAVQVAQEMIAFSNSYYLLPDRVSKCIRIGAI